MGKLNIIFSLITCFSIPPAGTFAQHTTLDMKTLSFSLIFSLLTVCLIAQTLPNPVRRALVIGVDGLSPNGIQKANTPVLDGLMRRGAYTMRARAITPSVSSPNWASIIMGADVEQHGVYSNDFERDQVILPPVVRGSAEIFPTIFGEIRAQRPNAEIGAIYQWGGFGRLFEKNAVNFDINPANEQATADSTVRYLINQKPEFCFVHLDHVDHAGHEYGHGTAAYYRSVERADSLIGQMLDGLRRAGMDGETLVLICADHGGIGNGHGGLTLEEMEVPFILAGPGVRAGYQIPTPVFQYDHAATILFAMGLEAPYAWIGRPVRWAFEGFSEPARNYPVVQLLEAPTFNHAAQGNQPAGGLFDKPVMVNLAHEQQGVVRYTVDGTIPTPLSKAYTQPFTVDRNTVVQAVLFQKEQPVSRTARAFYRFRKPDASAPVRYKCYLGEHWLKLPDFSRLQPASSGTCFEIQSSEVALPRSEQVAVVFETDLMVETAGEYAFFTRSDDGSRLYIDGKLVVDNDGDHGVLEVRGKTELTVGPHALRVEWFNGGGGLWVDAYWQGPGVPKQVLSVANFKK